MVLGAELGLQKASHGAFRTGKSGDRRRISGCRGLGAVGSWGTDGWVADEATGFLFGGMKMF